MIIAISGEIGSGKDTIGKIIQFLLTNKIREVRRAAPLIWEVFTDPKNQTVANNRNWDESGWEIKKFAGKLKQIASLMLGIPVEDLELEEVKNQWLGPEWNCTSEGGARDSMKVREFLQKLGTDAVRNNVHTNAWVNTLFADYKEDPRQDNEYDDRHPNWIITDCRFPNEAEAVEERGGLLIRVNRPVMYTSEKWQRIFPNPKVLDPDGWDRKNYQFSWHEELITLGEYQKRRMMSTCRATHGSIEIPHPSETALDNYNFKYVIDNRGSIEELINKVQIILEKENIL